jgi:hypothetical protein
MEQPGDPARSRSVGAGLARRLAVVREESFGARGVDEVARLLEIPPRTWSNYEGGVIIPGLVLLRFIELTFVEPMWLLKGEGPRYRTPRYHDEQARWD